MADPPGDATQETSTPPPGLPVDQKFIELLDDSDEDEEELETKRQRISEAPLPQQQGEHPAPGALLSQPQRSTANLPVNQLKGANIWRSHSNAVFIPGLAIAPHGHRQQLPGSPMAVAQATRPSAPGALAAASVKPIASQQLMEANKPYYMEFPANFEPSWRCLVPPAGHSGVGGPCGSPQHKFYQLSLLNLNEFALTGMPATFDQQPTPISDLRVSVRQISRPHGKSTFEHDNETGYGKWRVPIGAYHALLAYLSSIPNSHVEGIPQRQLQMASLERARQEKGYPTADELEEKGVPRRLAEALAPFQRGGVDFVLAKEGRAMIADEMGLGKTIQAIAAMSVYIDEWPILILTPSSARYHWQMEFLNWAGPGTTNGSQSKSTSQDTVLIRKHQINVLSSSNDPIFPNCDTSVVICSYGLSSRLVEDGKIAPKKFGCVIVDESHMLKNKNSRRARLLVPILAKTKRCVLLSGTPALACPAELWPQLQILQAERYSWWEDEADFSRKYVRQCGSREKAELHTMLTSTVMIRRYKSDILKTLPRKLRAKATFHVLTNENRPQFEALLESLRDTGGEMGRIARKHHVNESRSIDESSAVADDHVARQRTIYSHVDARVESLVDTDIPCLETRHNVLSRLYGLTGSAKIPVIVEMLKLWLNDPTKGKLCIFAHHIAVLDALENLFGLSGKFRSTGKYIRIDGSTSPKLRQGQIQMFQTDPSCKIALLGITAAGVAVTLTASSDVWFAELFWTPAIMIQAEDRCHRIGQNARVNCLYFVAKGTLDELLWRLVEEKFQELGEFVEGKEKQKIVVEAEYNSLKELHSIFDQADDLEDDEEDKGDQPTGFESLAQDLQRDSAIFDEIELFEVEEQRMLVDDDANETDRASSPLLSVQNDVASVAARQKLEISGPETEKENLGSTENEAICLVDSDEEVSQSKLSPRASGDKVEVSQPVVADSDCLNTKLSKVRLYKILIPGSSLGVSMGFFGGRIVVTDVLPSRIDREGHPIRKPGVGDILVSFNSTTLPILSENVQFQNVCQAIRQALAHSPGLKLMFAEDESFASYFIQRAEEKRRALLDKNRKAACDVVDLIDDDE